MFIEEALWIKDALQQIDPLKGNNLIANLGSSTKDFRTSVQPHIDEYILKPLAKKWNVVNIDLKKEDGVDIVANISDPNFANKYNNHFALTMCTNMLEHVESISDVAKNIFSVTIKNGYLLITVPYKYQLHYDPIDNAFRPTPKEIFELFTQGSVEIVSSKIIVITDKKYYPIKLSRFPIWGRRERIKYFFGFRHKVSGILLRLINK